MSPFGVMLRDARLRAGLRQSEIAEEMGYEQTYWSALELGTKGPPPLSFVEKLVNVLGLDIETGDALRSAILNSNRHMTLPADSPVEAFRVFSKLRRQISTLHPEQLIAIEQILDLSERLKGRGSAFVEPPRMRRRHSSPDGKEGAMA